MGQVFGLDIGVASVGWSVINDERIVDLGVRCFDKAETAKEGDPLNLIRRQSRLLRRRLYRRAWRLTKLARLLKKEELVDRAGFFKQQPGFIDSAWQLRVAGLDRLLEPTQWARVIYHLCKHRGFHWMSKAEEAKSESDSEGGRVKKGLQGTGRLMQEKGYRTAAEMVLSEFPQAQRNKNGQYEKALSRVLLDDELRQLFEAQRRLGNPHSSERFEQLIRGTDHKRAGLFWEQKPALSGENLLKMLGRCTFERKGGPDGNGEYRAPKASFSAERHVWLTRLNNLRVVIDGQARPLTDAERATVLLLPYTKETVKYKSLKSALVKAGYWASDARFGGMAYPSEAQQEAGKAKDPEDQTLVKLAAWHELRQAFEKAQGLTLWQQISTPALDGQPELLDSIAWVLSVYKDGEEVHQHLRQLPLPEVDTCVAILEKISFEKFSNLSLMALRQIVPLMDKGMRYDEAVASIPAYGHHSQLRDNNAPGSMYLPPFYEPVRRYNAKTDRVGSMVPRQDANLPRNPVVMRSLNQARKVVNALIKRYGSPTAVHIEMARDLSRPLYGHVAPNGKRIEGRKDVEALQKEFRDRNLQARADFEQEYGYQPKAAVFEKFMLYREQQGQSAYSQLPLDIARVLDDPNYVQIDHALPYSRSYDDSKNNKVLVLSRENQEKGYRTPYEYLTALDGGQEGDRWRAFNAWVQANKAYRLAKRNRLLRKNFGGDEARGFADRNLNDTRYICKFFKNYIEEHLQLAPKADGDTNRRCVVVNGQLTAFLRARWGLTKNREESDRHHALDAVVVAACSHGMVKALADHARRKELEFLKEGFADPETGDILNPAAFDRGRQHFPEPWPHFRHELQARLWTDDLATLRGDMARLGTYDQQALTDLRTLFVSRAPLRRNGGAVHKDTVYAQPEHAKKEGKVIKKVALSALKPKDLDNLVEPHRNARLYQAIRDRLAAYGGKAEQAFAPDKPFYKPSRDGETQGPLVSSVKVLDSETGIPIRGGLAKNDSMLRVDVYAKAGKYHLVPVYVHHRVTGLPDRAIVAFKEEKDWTLIDNGFQFLFSVYPNEYVRVQQEGKPKIEGYFGSAHRGTGTINIWLHDRNTKVCKAGAVEGIGVKTALTFEKFNVDILGHIYPAPAETRRGLA